ncbi:hypothetical protein AB0O32_15690 [Streptomyces rubiginosohelvolus]|uniref:hypothetical protein n=1 Tax=Streptomyces rubiginosohelvolus TaxID=67362 RepID=UPI00341C6F5C
MNPRIRRTGCAFALGAASIAAALSTAAPATAGGIGDLLSPAFGVDCENHRIGSQASGGTAHGTGTIGGNVGRIPLASALNQCGGADLPMPAEADKPQGATSTISAVDVENTAVSSDALITGG